ncbi:MAG: hydrogenase maturation nickel metallochaperone HypA [bacterium]|nr:hydrogenase maturation nickel metallochaperone HypA [bacterium]
MHEFALAQDIVDTISTKVTDALETVTLINLDVGAFSGVVADSLDFGLTTILADKKNSDVKIHINQIPSIARCECGNEYELKEIYESCTLCNSYNRTMISGMDIVINSVEIKDISED